jgi:1-acyl-sn-glycerol-3-phosphate acyltransferase
VRAVKQFHDEGYGYDVFGLDPGSLALAAAAAAPIYDHYFRVESRGIEQLPREGPAILVANHGGMLPVDGAMLCLDVLRHSTPPRILRAIADHFVARLPLVSTLLARCGVVNGTRANARLLLERGELIAIFPEGISGPAKPFRERYRLQSWRVGFAALAIRFRAPVIPVAIVGAEESWPLAGRLRAFRMFGTPYLPIPASPLPLPARFHLRYGAPIYLHHDDLAEADDPVIVSAGAERVRAALELLLAQTLGARRGVFR